MNFRSYYCTDGCIYYLGRTHKNVWFRSPNRLTTQSEKSLDLAVMWSAFSLLGLSFWILASTCHMVHCRWTQMIKDGICLQIKVFSCNIRYGICKKRRSWLVPSFNCKRRINSKDIYTHTHIYIYIYISKCYTCHTPITTFFSGRLQLLLPLQDLTQFERLSQNL